jgi:hypothetical protein
MLLRRVNPSVQIFVIFPEPTTLPVGARIIKTVIKAEITFDILSFYILTLMRSKTILFLFIFSLIPFMTLAQQGSVKGRVFDESNNEPVPYANIIVFGTTIGTSSDLDGNYSLTGLNPGFVKLAATAVGFESKVTEDFQVTNSKTFFIDIPLKPREFELKEVVVKSSPFARIEESPLSLRTLQISEIEKSPGGNRDISKVIQILPGVSSTPAFRNDVIVRGGGGNENAFYLDGCNCETFK